MAEPFGKPTNEQVRKLRDYYGDPFLWFVCTNTIKRLNDFKVKEITDDSELNWWKHKTRYFLRKFGGGAILELLYKEIERVSNEQWVDGFPTWVFKDTGPVQKSSQVKTKLKGNKRKAIDSKLKISEVAKKYGLKVDRKGMTICPFHEDNNPSLSLNDEKNVFYCFGCQSKGDIITFIGMMEDLKNGKKRS